MILAVNQYGSLGSDASETDETRNADSMVITAVKSGKSADPPRGQFGAPGAKD